MEHLCSIPLGTETVEDQPVSKQASYGIGIADDKATVKVSRPQASSSIAAEVKNIWS